MVRRTGAGPIWRQHFQIAPDGTGYTSVFSFGPSDFGNSLPGVQGNLAVAGSTIYGVTTNGGANDCGTVYKVGDNGTGLNILHSFTGDDGLMPTDGLILVGSTLYGTTHGGSDGSGNPHDGTCFKVNVDGTGFSVLRALARRFQGGAPAGNWSSSAQPCSAPRGAGETMAGELSSRSASMAADTASVIRSTEPEVTTIAHFRRAV